MKQKLLVTGASGFLGWNLCQQAAAEWEVYGTYLSHLVAIPEVTKRRRGSPLLQETTENTTRRLGAQGTGHGASRKNQIPHAQFPMPTKSSKLSAGDELNFIQVDLRDFEALKSLFAQINPAAVIHTAAQSSPNTCQEYPDEAYAINVTASLNLARLSADLGIPFAFTSTDLVFDGKNAPYREDDPVSPLNLYGEQKAIAEQKILECYPDAAVCRMPLMFGVASSSASSFIQPFIQKLREGKELRLFADEFRTPVSASTAAKGLLLALSNVQGLLHLGGKERVSRYQFGRLMVEVLQLPGAKLTACLQKDVPMAAPRPSDVSLDSSKAFALGYQPLSIKEELENLRGKV